MAVHGTVLRLNSTRIHGAGFIVALGEGLQQSGQVRVAVDRSQLTQNIDYGIFVGRRARATIADTLVSDNGTGLAASAEGEPSGETVTTSVEVDRSTITNNRLGIVATSSASGAILNLALRGSTVSGSTNSAITLGEYPGTTLTDPRQQHGHQQQRRLRFRGAGGRGATRGNNVVRMNAIEIQGGGAVTPLAGTWRWFPHPGR